MLRILLTVIFCMISVACSSTMPSAKNASFAKISSVQKPTIIKEIKKSQQAKVKKIKKEDTAEELFASVETVSEKELSDIRGAYVTANGIVLDFGLMTQTIVNGELVSSLVFDLNGNANFDGLKQNIKITSEGVDVQKTDIANQSLITTIQNDQNDQFIQQSNILNLEVSNLQSFSNQTLVPAMNVHSPFFGQ